MEQDTVPTGYGDPGHPKHRPAIAEMASEHDQDLREGYEVSYDALPDEPVMLVSLEEDAHEALEEAVERLTETVDKKTEADASTAEQLRVLATAVGPGRYTPLPVRDVLAAIGVGTDLELVDIHQDAMYPRLHNAEAAGEMFAHLSGTIDLATYLEALDGSATERGEAFYEAIYEAFGNCTDLSEPPVRVPLEERANDELRGVCVEYGKFTPLRVRFAQANMQEFDSHPGQIDFIIDGLQGSAATLATEPTCGEAARSWGS